MLILNFFRSVIRYFSLKVLASTKLCSRWGSPSWGALFFSKLLTFNLSKFIRSYRAVGSNPCKNKRMASWTSFCSCRGSNQGLPTELQERPAKEVVQNLSCYIDETNEMKIFFNTRNSPSRLLCQSRVSFQCELFISIHLRGRRKFRVAPLRGSLLRRRRGRRSFTLYTHQKHHYKGENEK